MITVISLYVIGLVALWTIELLTAGLTHAVIQRLLGQPKCLGLSENDTLSSPSPGLAIAWCLGGLLAVISCRVGWQYFDEGRELPLLFMFLFLFGAIMCLPDKTPGQVKHSASESPVANWSPLGRLSGEAIASLWILLQQDAVRVV